jgi:hypothetical protein
LRHVQSIQHYATTQRTDDAQDLLKPYRRLATFHIHDETHANSGSQSQIRLGQTELPSGGTQ